VLWYNSWLETRFRFLIGLALLLCSAVGTVLFYPQVLKLIPLVPTNVSGELGRRIREGADLVREYRGYVWSKWFGDNLLKMATLFAILLGTGGLLSRRAALFTLSMPASRNRLLGIRATTGLAELFVLVFAPSLLIPLLSPAIRESYGVGNALIHSACAFIVASVFFGLAFLLSSVFSDLWRPLLIALAIAIVIGLADEVFYRHPYSIFRVMSAENYFRSGHVPWGGLLGSVALSAALYYGAMANLARRDF
jgi:hypothetical protein